MFGFVEYPPENVQKHMIKLHNALEHEADKLQTMEQMGADPRPSSGKGILIFMFA